MEIKTIRESMLFKLALGLPLLLSFVTAIGISYLIWDTFSFGISSVESFKNFYEVYKIPLALLTASPVTAGIAAVIHRSDETAKQIQLTEDKNNFENYIKHNELFNQVVTSFTNGGGFSAYMSIWYDNGDGNEGHLEDNGLVDCNVLTAYLYNYLFPRNKGAKTFGFYIDDDVVKDVEEKLAQVELSQIKPAMVRHMLDLEYVKGDMSKVVSIELDRESELKIIRAFWMHLTEFFKK